MTRCHASPPRAARRIAWPSGGAVGCTLAAAVLPKCPACLLVYLAPLGVGLGFGATLLAVLRPAFVGLAALAMLVAVVRWHRRKCCPQGTT